MKPQLGAGIKTAGLFVAAAAGMFWLAPGTSGATLAEKAYTKPLSTHSHTQTQTMIYQVYAGGVHAVEAELDVSYEKNNRYHLRLEAETIGFLRKLVPWSGTFETAGWRLKDKIERPEIHRSEAIWRGEEDLKEYHYGKDGSFQKLLVKEAGQDLTPDKVDAGLSEGTTDVLTATLGAMKKVAESGQCDGKSEVFDGSRRFALAFNHDTNEKLSTTDYNIYEGDATRCTVEVIPMGGEWHKKPRGWMSIQEQGRLKGSLPTVWMARLDAKGPAVPVKVRVKTDYGTLFMHLTEYRSGDTIIKASAE